MPSHKHCSIRPPHWGLPPPCNRHEGGETSSCAVAEVVAIAIGRGCWLALGSFAYDCRVSTARIRAGRRVCAGDPPRLVPGRTHNLSRTRSRQNCQTTVSTRQIKATGKGQASGVLPSHTTPTTHRSMPVKPATGELPVSAHLARLAHPVCVVRPLSGEEDPDEAKRLGCGSISSSERQLSPCRLAQLINLNYLVQLSQRAKAETGCVAARHAPHLHL